MSHARQLSCPACELPMKVVDRGGIHIDRCGGCKGVFLDNGELEKLITLMTAADDDDDWLQPPTRQQPAQPAPVYHSPPPVHESHHHHHHGHHHGGKHYNYKHRKKSAMKTFMDIFD